MCLNPISIQNNTHRFAVGKSKLSFNVPCGQCDDCRANKKNEWFLRCYHEFLENKSHHGSTFFLTLTYADEFLPHFDFPYKSFQDGKIVQKHLSSPCFSYDDIHKFINSLRVILKRTFIDVKLRYIIFSEYGEKTQRPHYHCLFFTSRYLTPIQFFRCVDGYDNDKERRKFYKWSKDKPYFITPEHPDGYVQRGAWHNGWVLVSKPSQGGMVVRSQKSIMYCAKYSTKDLSFYHKEDVLDYRKSIFDSRLYSELDRRELLSKLNHYLPRHYNSPSLGFMSLKTQFLSDYNKYIREGFTIQVGQKDSVSYRLPEYYKRKILYRYDVQKNEDGTKKIVWYYCPDSKDIHLAYLRHNIHKYIKKLDKVFSPDFVNIVPDEDLFSLGFTRSSLLELFAKVRAKYTNYQIAVFNYVYHGRSCRFDCLDGAEPVNDLIHYVSQYERYYVQNIDNRYDNDYMEPYLKKHYDEFHYSYDVLPCFSLLSDFLAVLDGLFVHIRDYEVNFVNFLNIYRDLFIPVGLHSVPSFDV